jgi:transcriptional regulator with XRE-family HTH domain
VHNSAFNHSDYTVTPQIDTLAPAAAKIADRLRLERQKLNLSQGDFGAQVGVSKTTQFNYEAGARMPDAMYLNQAAALGVDVHFVVTGKRREPDDDYVVIPRHDIVASAGPGVLNGAEATVGGLSFSRRWLSERRLAPQNLTVIEVAGSSMEGRLSNGDLVLVDFGQTTPKSGFAYVLRQGEELLVKYCQLLPDGVLRVSSENASYPAYNIDLTKGDDVSIVGRVVASTHEW